MTAPVHVTTQTRDPAGWAYDQGVKAGRRAVREWTWIVLVALALGLVVLLALRTMEAARLGGYYDGYHEGTRELDALVAWRDSLHLGLLTPVRYEGRLYFWRNPVQTP